MPAWTFSISEDADEFENSPVVVSNESPVILPTERVPTVELKPIVL